jgi:FkbM family methyltransferase
MNGWRACVNSLQKILSRSALAVRAALLVRNQAESIIGYHLGDDAEVTDKNNSERWLIEQVAPVTKTFVDVGANDGAWTRIILSHASTARGWLFEPVAHLAADLKTEFAANPSIQIIPEAVCDMVGERTLYVASGDAKTSSLAKDVPVGTITAKIIRTTTLDEASARLGFHSVDFLKIDAEGFDLDVLLGAENLLKLQSIGILQFEYGNAWPFAGNTLAAALHYLREHSYQIYLLRRNGLFRFSYQKYREFFRYATFVGLSTRLVNNFGNLVAGDA